MSNSQEPQSDTPQKVLKSAVDVFAEKGFRDATIHEICQRAGANIAAVNYYFRSKENLYVEAWRKAFRDSLEAYPAGGGVPPGAPVEERLRGRVLSIVWRITDPKNYEFQIAHKELANPTGLLAEVMRQSIEPIRLGLVAVVRELLGEKAAERHVLLCRMSIMAQCLHLLIHEMHGKIFPKGPPPPGPPPLDLDIEAIADHVTRFSLAGIREIRQQIESGKLE